MEQAKQTFWDRPVRLIWVARMIAALVLIGLVVLGIQAWRAAGMRDEARAALRRDIQSKGIDIARTIAVTSREDILNRSYDKLQGYCADIVSQRDEPDVRYIAIITPDGQAVVHTDAKFRGRRLGDDISRKAAEAADTLVQDIEADRTLDIAVPVMAFTRKAAVVRVGLSYARAAQLFRSE